MGNYYEVDVKDLKHRRKIISPGSTNFQNSYFTQKKKCLLGKRKDVIEVGPDYYPF